MTLQHLELALGNMLDMIAEKGGDNVKIVRDDSKLSVEITKPNGNGSPAETFSLFLSSSIRNAIIAYGNNDRSLLKFPVPEAGSSIDGIVVSKQDLAAINAFAGRIIASSRRLHDSPFGINHSYDYGRVPAFVAYFAERML